jgi:hypothetical protein
VHAKLQRAVSDVSPGDIPQAVDSQVCSIHAAASVHAYLSLNCRLEAACGTLSHPTSGSSTPSDHSASPGRLSALSWCAILHVSATSAFASSIAGALGDHVAALQNGLHGMRSGGETTCRHAHYVELPHLQVESMDDRDPNFAWNNFVDAYFLTGASA